MRTNGISSNKKVLILSSIFLINFLIAQLILLNNSLNLVLNNLNENDSRSDSLKYFEEYPESASISGATQTNFDYRLRGKSNNIIFYDLNETNNNVTIDIPQNWIGNSAEISVLNYSTKDQLLNNTDFDIGNYSWNYNEYSIEDEYKYLDGKYNATNNDIQIDMKDRITNKILILENFTNGIPPEWIYYELDPQNTTSGQWDDSNGEGSILIFRKDGSAYSHGGYQYDFVVTPEKVYSASLQLKYAASVSGLNTLNMTMKCSISKQDAMGGAIVFDKIIYSSTSGFKNWTWDSSDLTNIFQTNGPGIYRLSLYAEFKMLIVAPVNASAWFTDVKLDIDQSDIFLSGTMAYWEQKLNLSSYAEGNVKSANLVFKYATDNLLPSSNQSYISFWINDTRSNVISFKDTIKDENKHQLVFLLNQTLLNQLENDEAIFKIGFYNNNSSLRFDNNTWIAFDEIYLNIEFVLFNPAVINITVKELSDSAWQELGDDGWILLKGDTDWNKDNATFIFNTTDPRGFNKLNVEIILNVYKLISDSMNVKYHVPSPNATVFWNISFSTTLSISELQNAQNPYNSSGCHIDIYDLPSLDGNGVNSNDWNILNVYSPYSNDLMQSIQLSSTNPYYKNLTIPSIAISDWFSEGKGTFWINAVQPNYINNVWLENSSFNQITKTYFTNITYFNATSINSSIAGNYNFTLYNRSGYLMSGFPKYNLSSVGYGSVQWIVEDLKPDSYEIVVFWNDTSGTYTYRIGYRSNWFLIFRTTIGNVTKGDLMLQPGKLGNIQLDYNYTPQNLGVEDANITVFNNATGNEWGIDFLGYSQIYNIQYNGNGNYSFDVGTIGVPTGEYTLRIECSKEFYNPIILYTNISLAGTNITIKFIKGVYKLGNNYFLTYENTPHVNETAGSEVILYLTDQSTGDPLENAFIIPRIGEKVFDWKEIYKSTGNPQDRGKYSISIDATGMHNNTWYNLTIIVQKEYYNPNSTFILFSPLRRPTDIIVPKIDPIIEEQSVQLFANYQDILEENPKGINNASVKYEILNLSMQVEQSGTMDPVFPGVYSSLLELNGPNYLPPGQYIIRINGSKEDFENASNADRILTILSKNQSLLDLSIIGECRAGHYIQLSAYLTYSNGTPIQNQNIQFNVTFGSNTNFQNTQITNASGIATLDILLDETQINITVDAKFEGTTSIKPSSDSEFRVILPKYISNITFTNIPQSVRVGTELSAQLNLSFGNSITPSGRKIIFKAYYDSESLYFHIEEIYTDQFGGFELFIPEIADKKSSIKIEAIFEGDSMIKPCSNFTIIPILPKLASNLNIINYTNSLFNTEFIQINAKLTFENNSPIIGGIIRVFVGTKEHKAITDENGIATFSIAANDLKGDIKITIFYEGEKSIQNSQNIQIPVHVDSFEEYQAAQRTKLMINIGIVGIIISIVSLVLYRAIVIPKRKKREERLKELEQRFFDAENIQLIEIIFHSGTELLSKIFTDIPVDPSLLSGFISALASFGSEIATTPPKTASEEKQPQQKINEDNAEPQQKQKQSFETGIELLSYKQFKMLIEEGPKIKLAALLLQPPSLRFKQNMKNFLKEFQIMFKERIDAEYAPILHYKDARSLFVKFFDTHLVETCIISEEGLKNAKLTKFESKIIEIIASSYFNGEFKPVNLKTKLESIYPENKLEILEGIFDLFEQKVFVSKKFQPLLKERKQK
ncbi:MAG: hypothetical protein ACTSRZ_07895 [Promethearchaeota archaeon]